MRGKHAPTEFPWPSPQPSPAEREREQSGTITDFARQISLEGMFKGFRAVRKLRQKPAHAVNENIFDLKYFKEQRQLIIDAYNSVRTLRLIFANHPKVKKNPPEIGKHLERGEIWDI